MKAKIFITPKPTVVDPQGQAVRLALEHMGYGGIDSVHVGKYIEVDLAPGYDPDATRQALEDAGRRFLSNPNVEEYRLEMPE